MKVKRIEIVLRKDGHFHLKDRKVKAVRGGNGFGVMVFLEPSQIDKDFEERVWVPSALELKEIQQKLETSDEKTHELIGHGWGGERPFYKLEDFM